MTSKHWWVVGLTAVAAIVVTLFLLVEFGPRAEITIHKSGEAGFKAQVSIEESLLPLLPTYSYSGDSELTNTAPGVKAAYQDGLAIADKYGIKDRIRFAPDSLIDDDFQLPEQVRVRLELEQYFEEQTKAYLISTDYGSSDWQYFRFPVEPPSGQTAWPHRQTALAAATAVADHYGLRIVEVIDQ